MMPVDLYSETLKRIYNLRGGVIDLRLDRMDQALALFGHPEKNFPSFHIAGTNGKGSTAAMLHRILSLAGYRTALYTSPHLVSFTERIRVGEREISPEEVVELADEVHHRTAAANIQLTFFEFVTVMAFIYFERHGADVAVVEVGLGGRLDATNLVRPVVSVITTISKDHETYLGSELTSIAREKAGIIKSGIPVVCGHLPAEAADVVRTIASSRGVSCYLQERDFTYFLKNEGRFDYKGLAWYLEDLSIALWGRHQRQNATVALAALEIGQKDFAVTESVLRQGLETVQWPGRFEVLLNDPVVVLDGAHNGEGVKALTEGMEDFRQGRKVKLLFASMEDKDWRLMLNTLAGVVEEVVLTRVDMQRSADPHLLANHLTGKVNRRVIEDARSALNFLFDKAQPEEIILAAGSLYLLGEIRPAVQEFANSKSAKNKTLNSTL